VVVGNARGRFTASAKVTEDTRPGTVAALGLRWQSSGRFLASESDGREISDTVIVEHGQDAEATINDTTSMELTDLGRGATFYDNAVEIWLAGQVSREAVLS
jgi:anaerobic selenocysteine-containing dehydrogenase